MFGGIPKWSNGLDCKSGGSAFVGSNPTASIMLFANSVLQGNSGLGQAIAHYTGLGHIISIPLTDSQSYDLLVDMGGHIRKVQVKTTTHKRRGVYIVDLRTKGGNMSGIGKTKKIDKSIDEVFILTGDGQRYIIQRAYLEEKATLTLGPEMLNYRVWPT